METTAGTARPVLPETGTGHIQGSRPGRGRRIQDLVFSVWGVAFVCGLVTLAIYGPHLLQLGWYLDDWSFFAAMQDAPSQSWPDVFDACRTVDSAGRPGGCMYHATIYTLFGHSLHAYHVLSVGLLVLGAVLIYVLLTRMRLPRWAALAISVLYVVYPGSDSTRLWPASIGAQYILAVYVAGLLFGIAAVRRPLPRALPWHALSLACFALMVFTYEAVLPIIAVAGAAYLVSGAPRRRALVRGAVDLVLAIGFTGYRLFIDPVDAGSGFVVHRTIGGWIGRLVDIWRGAWTSWHVMYIPDVLGVVLAVAAVLFIAITAVLRPGTRRQLTPWFWVAVAAAAYALVSVTAYVTANDYYVPDPHSTFDRLNLAAAPAYAAVAVAGLAMLGIALRAWSTRAVAVALPVVLTLGFAGYQISVSERSQLAWAQSWYDQSQVVAAVKQLFGRVPSNASVVSFGHPQYTGWWLPVFSTDWDIRGAVDVETHVDPPKAVPFVEGIDCGTRGVTNAGKLYMPYHGKSPVWFVNAVGPAVRHITSKSDCTRAAAEWGRVPAFAPASH